MAFYNPEIAWYNRDRESEKDLVMADKAVTIKKGYGKTVGIGRRAPAAFFTSCGSGVSANYSLPRLGGSFVLTGSKRCRECPRCTLLIARFMTPFSPRPRASSTRNNDFSNRALQVTRASNHSTRKTIY